MRWIFLLLLISSAPGVYAQDTLIRKSSLIPLPVFGYSPEKGLEMGAGIYYSFYTDRKTPHISTRNSTLQLSGTFSTEKQYKLDLKADLWTPKNTWHIRPQIRYHDSPFIFYGLGDTTLHRLRSRVNNEQYKINLEVERLLFPNFYAGLSFLFQKDEFSSNDDGIYSLSPLTDKEGGHATFFGASAVFDNRDNQNYTREGAYLRFQISYTPPMWSKRELTSLVVEARSFWSLSPKFTLGAHGVFNTLQGKRRPFYFLPSMGNDQIMRGYQGGRFRDQSYAALQTELRFFLDPKIYIKLPFVDDTPTFALAAFAGTGSVFPNGSFRMDRLKPTYGLGVRYFYDEVSRLTLRMDYGWGEKIPGESRQGALYLTIGEAF